LFLQHSLIVDLCNKNQLDALFILSLFRQSTYTCLWHICSPSSGGALCVYNNCYAFQLTVCWPANTYQLLYIYSIPPDDELQICLRHAEVD